MTVQVIPLSKEYLENYDRVFGTKVEEEPTYCAETVYEGWCVPVDLSRDNL